MLNQSIIIDTACTLGLLSFATSKNQLLQQLPRTGAVNGFLKEKEKKLIAFPITIMQKI